MNQNFLWILILLNLFLISALGVDFHYETCSVPKTCSNHTQQIKFPFYIQEEQENFCGFPGFNLSCDKNDQPIIRLSDNDYVIHQIFYKNHSLRVSNAAAFDYTNTTCVPSIHNLSLPASDPFQRISSTNIFLLYNCNSSSIGRNLTDYKHDCPGSNFSTLVLFEENPDLGYALDQCRNGIVTKAPVETNGMKSDGLVVETLRTGFGLSWTASNCSVCEQSRGICGFDYEVYQFRCFCTDRPHARQCDIPGHRSLKLKLGLGLGIGVPAILMAMISTYLFRLRHCKRECNSRESNNASFNHSSKSDLEGGTLCFGVPIFSYSELKEATNHFDSEKELGDGGFGTVYYGKLRDGREVAVKRLYEHNYRKVKVFMNEVEILTRLHHKNLVTLYGCTSRHSRELLLVYEYISNGTVADHLHGDRATPCSLPWSIRLSIAIETASALSYLHASDIVHRDVKTTNILLDDNFCVKVADFGLSRLFPTDVTHVSTAPQGTPGYVDPEYHKCYQLTEKSDVYSFGVVLIELISSMPAVDISRDRDEINLANLAIDRIEKCAFDQLIDKSLEYRSDEEVRKMITDVAKLAFRCLQHEKEMRPSMMEALKELEMIQSGESKSENAEGLHDNNQVLQSERPLSSPSECDKLVLSKNIRPPASPISATDMWVSVNSERPPPSQSEYDKRVLLKNIRPPASPISVTEKWVSVDTTPNSIS